jgi:hypothetical protein
MTKYTKLSMMLHQMSTCAGKLALLLVGSLGVAVAAASAVAKLA